MKVVPHQKQHSRLTFIHLALGNFERWDHLSMMNISQKIINTFRDPSLKEELFRHDSDYLTTQFLTFQPLVFVIKRAFTQ
jgi:hypothetical protein